MPPDGTLTEYEVNNMIHGLRLLQRQIRNGNVEWDYAGRQVEKALDVMHRFKTAQKEEADGGRFEALYNVSRMLGASLDLHTVLERVMDAVIQLTRAERGFLMLRDDDGNLKVEVARNLDQQTINSDEFETSRTISNYVMDKGESIITTNAAEDSRFNQGKSVITQHLRSILATPLRARGRVLGIAYVENRFTAGLFTEEDMTTLETLMAQASVAIDNAMLFAETDEELSKRVEELRTLRRIDLLLNEKLDPEEAVSFTLETICRMTRATAGHVGFVQSDAQRIVATHHYYGDQSSTPTDTVVYLDDAYPRLAEVMQTKEAITYDTGQYSLLSVLIAPIIRDKEVNGAIVLSRDDGGTFNEEAIDLVQRIVGRAVVTIENARLYSAVQAADKAKTEFVGVVAHDLKAPMTNIRGYADLLAMQEDQLDARQMRFINNISRTVRRMEMLVSDLADISRIESGEFLMREISVPIDKVVEDLGDTIAPEMQARNHTYTTDVEPNLPSVWTDYYRLMQVLTNLLSNAYKYTPDGGNIQLRVQREGERVRFTVKDDGMGMSPEQTAKLGTKFWRAEDEFTRSQPGTGLGFSITSSLVQQMGSQMEITSEVGQGSQFSFTVAIDPSAA